MVKKLTLKDSYTEKRIYGIRTIFAGVFVLSLLLVLVARYFNLQITEHDTYKTQSDRNRVQLQPIPPKRGLIYDRNGVLLAENRASYSLTIVKEHVDDIDKTLVLLQQLISINKEHLDKFQRLLKRRRPYAAVPLKLNLTEAEIASISVNRYRLPGVDVDAQLARHYPQGKLFAHTLGYVGRINEEEQRDIDEVNYSGTLQIGKIGLEKYYEDRLHGTVGYQQVETNARGRVLRVLDRTNPEPGVDLRLHIDAAIQRVAYEALSKENQRGAVVAIDPKTGGIIAMVSTPSFDSNLFVNGISSRNYNELRNSPDLPLFNRTLQGQYPPASTVKPLYGLAGLHYGIVTEQTTIIDRGWFKLPNDDRLYRDWTWQKYHRGHINDRGTNEVALEHAILRSCNTYFFDLAYKMGIDRMHDFLSPFSYGEKTGIDSTSERSGLLPSKEWKRRYKQQAWFPGETLSAGIGQGYLLVTPVQLATAVATIANKGVRFVPRLVSRISSTDIAPPVLPTIEVEDNHWNAVINAMKKVIHDERGTARAKFRKLKYKVAGKTGSAQKVTMAQDEKYDLKDISKRNRDHGLFIGFAPADNPKIAVAVIVENGLHGSWVSSIAREVFDAYLLDEDGNYKYETPESEQKNIAQQVPSSTELMAVN